MIGERKYILTTPNRTYYRHLLGWPSKGLTYHAKNQLLPNHLRKRTSKRAKYRLPLPYKNRPVKITMYLGLDNIIKLKFPTNFDRCTI